MEKYKVSEWRFIARWTFANFLGVLMGIGVVAAASSILPSSSYLPDPPFAYRVLQFLNGVFICALFGAVIGIIQWLLILKEKVNRSEWIAANIVAILISIALYNPLFAMQPDLFTKSTSQASGMYVTSTLADTWVVNVISTGLAFGLIYGIPYWLVLRASLWIISTITAVILAFGWYIGLVYMSDNDLTADMLCCCTNPILIGVVTGGALFRLLYKQKREADY